MVKATNRQYEQHSSKTCATTHVAFKCAHCTDISALSAGPDVPEAVQEARKRLQDLVSSAETGLTVLKRRLNKLSPVNSLPLELLVHIFLYHRDSQYLDGVESPVEKPEVLTTSHVCYHWRTVALSTPLLWTALDLRFPRLAAATIPRAATLPLCICLSPEQALEDAECEFYVDGYAIESSRPLQLSTRASGALVAVLRSKACYRLDLVGGTKELDCALGTIRKCGQELQSLNIRYQASDHDDEHYFAFCIPDKFAEDTYPKLGFLLLRNCDVNWKSSLMRSNNLRHLEISSKECVTDTRDLRDILAALRASPRLEYLCLMWWNTQGSWRGWDLDDSNGWLGADVSFGRLQTLTLWNEPAEVHALLSKLHVPGTCRMDVHLGCEPVFASALTRNALRYCARRLFEEHAPEGVREFRLTLSPRKASLSTMLDGDPDCTPRCQLMAEVDSHADWEVHGPLIDFLQLRKSFCGAKAIVVSGFNVMPTLASPGLFRACSAQVVHVVGAAAAFNFTAAMSDAKPEDFIPRMSTLILEGTRVETVDGCSARGLSATLERYAIAGDLQKLVLKRCIGPSPSTLKEWRDTLHEVHLCT